MTKPARQSPSPEPGPDAPLVQRVRRRLAKTPAVTERKMFGSIAFLVGGKLCVTARSERLMCRINPALHETAQKEPGIRVVKMGGRLYRGYFHVAADSVRTAATLGKWIDRALAHNRAQRAG